MDHLCIGCNAKIPSSKAKNKYCSHSCRASIVNKTRQIALNPNWHRVRYNCVVCSTASVHLKFCSKVCQDDHFAMQFNRGLLHDRNALKRQMLRTHPYACFECYLSTWKGETLPLEVDHIDGDASNNLPSNLRLLCGNCHSITPTWKGKNRGKGRKARNLPVH